jgi:hypothetical protein
MGTEVGMSCETLPLFNLDPTTADRFDEFHAANPHVYEALVRLAREWVQRTGRRQLGMKALFERARWDLVLSTTDPDFVLNNDYTPFYSRLIMARESDLSGLFALRRSTADELFGRSA